MNISDWDERREKSILSKKLRNYKSWSIRTFYKTSRKSSNLYQKNQRR